MATATSTTKKKKTSTSSSTGAKKTKSSTRMTTREKMIQRKKDLEKRGQGGGIIFPKEGVTRLRIKSQGDDKELGMEIITFYLGGDFGGITSPASFDEECPLMEKYLELKESKDDDDKELAGRLAPRRRYIVGGIGYKDDKGKEVDPDRVDKAFQVPRSVYNDIIDLYLDEDEWGDMTDDQEGYDIKIIRSGSGKNDTNYSVMPCAKKPLDKKYRGEVDLEKIVRNQVKSYEELEEILEKWLNEDHDEEEEKPKKKKVVKKSSKGKNGKTKGRDI